MTLQNNKALGQHWLKDRAILDEIAELSVPNTNPPAPEAPKAESSAPGASSEAESPVCLEIGPGLGTLTSSLLRVYPRVLAVEVDKKLAENLPKSFPGKNLTVVNADFLNCDLSKMPKGYVVCANIPYYITSPIIKKLLEDENPPARITLLIQKEVAERIAAGREGISDEDGARVKAKHTTLSLFVQNRATVMLGPVVERGKFTPPPKVDSQVLILDPHSPIVSDEVMKLIRLGFSSPRKKVIKNLIKHKAELKPIFEELEIPLDSRPGDLVLTDWKKLYRAISD